MKPRTVILTIEMETDIPIREIRSFALDDWGGSGCARVLQVQANVIRPTKKPKPLWSIDPKVLAKKRATKRGKAKR